MHYTYICYVNNIDFIVNMFVYVYINILIRYQLVESNI